MSARETGSGHDGPRRNSAGTRVPRKTRAKHVDRMWRRIEPGAFGKADGTEWNVKALPKKKNTDRRGAMTGPRP